MLDYFLQIFKQNPSKTALISSDIEYSYNDLLNQIDSYYNLLVINNIAPSEIISIQSELSFYSIALLFALIKNKNIIIPLSPFMFIKIDEYNEIAETEKSIELNNSGEINIITYNRTVSNQLLVNQKKSKDPGLILFSSGTAGKSKAILHNLNLLLKKYHKKGKDYSTIAFMHYDHIGGIDTLFYSLSNSSTLFLALDRSPDKICNAIQKFKLQVLPTTPSFLNLLILSDAFSNYDLSSLRYITYGTEPMPESLLIKLKSIFPDVILMQKFGTTEVGTLRSKSKQDTSTWVRLGGEGFDTKVVDGILYIKADSAMLGYLNAPSPFTDDGWFITGDKVEVDGDYYRILGRETEIINVGGEKVYPSEVESIILELPFIKEVTVFGEPNNLLGNIVCSEILLSDSIDSSIAKKEIKKHCSSKLQSFKVPVKIKFVEESNLSERFKKKRVKND